ncbi:MAG: hypothetical protein QXZ66_10500 [Thermoproteota archaeon]
MLQRCHVCGKTGGDCKPCGYCGWWFCGKHIDPEQHGCTGRARQTRIASLQQDEGGQAGMQHLEKPSGPKRGLSPEMFKGFSKLCVSYVHALKGREIDYTPESLLIVDKAINEGWPKDFFKGVEPAGSFSLSEIRNLPARSGEMLTIIILVFGSYLGEVILRNIGGGWEMDEHAMFKWGVRVPAGSRVFLVNVFHIAHESLIEPSKLFNSYVMAEVHKNLVDKGGVEAFKRREDFEREVKAFYEKHMDAIKKVLEPGENPPGFYGYFMVGNNQ